MKAFLISWKGAAPAAGAILAFVSACVALAVLIYTRRANRRRATLDIVMKTLLEDGARQQQEAFRNVIKRDQDPNDPLTLASLLEPAAKGTPDRRAMLHQLNIYELIAIGIRRGIFDEAFYKRWFHNQFLIDYESSAQFVKGLQKRKQSIFCECTALYTKWTKHGHPEVSRNRFVIAWWGLSKQFDRIDREREKQKAR